MKIGILGSGPVGVELAKGFLAEGHEVWLATREQDGEKADQLKADVSGATVTDFETAAREAELAVLAVNSSAINGAIELAGADALSGKVVIDTTNIIKQEGDAMIYGGEDKSAAEKIQELLPDSRVVKAFNTMGAGIMYKPELSPTPSMFIAGDDADAKQQVIDIAATFGWDAIDAGGLISSRELEAMAVVMIRFSMSKNEWNHTFKML